MTPSLRAKKAKGADMPYDKLERSELRGMLAMPPTSTWYRAAREIIELRRPPSRRSGKGRK